ncbi:hypothetical protein H2199_001872 [Coniosporium tulheliwenetii]|uniref:Uncharacterized protein n=1 Tax=Coniosporium tulheliwenetii TaxID=3383036 RepID=A0ACC2ZKM5_9PEZI|nr:hypothetical protein H2199_001872 [Cladosporium sp. JES 115]
MVAYKFDNQLIVRNSQHTGIKSKDDKPLEIGLPKLVLKLRLAEPNVSASGKTEPKGAHNAANDALWTLQCSIWQTLQKPARADSKFDPYKPVKFPYLMQRLDQFVRFAECRRFEERYTATEGGHQQRLESDTFQEQVSPFRRSCKGTEP